MPYTTTNWVDFVTAASAANLNHIEAGIYAADQGFYNVKAYGAAGNGVTNDTTPIQTAIDAARTAGGGVVFFPAGTYIVSLTLNPNVGGLYAAFHVGSNTTLAGAGPGATIIKLANNAAVDQQRMISNYNPQSSGTDIKICIRDMTINGNAFNQTGVVGLDLCDGIHLRYVREVAISNVICKNHFGTTNGANGPGGTAGENRSLLTWFCADVVYLNCEAFVDDGGGTSAGIASYNSMNVHMDGCNVHDMTYSYGIGVFECSAVSLVNCTVYNSSNAGFLVEICSQVTIDSCQAGSAVLSYGQAGPFAASTHTGVTNAGFKVFGCTHVVIVNSSALYCGLSGFNFNDASSPLVVQNDVTVIGCMSGNATNHGFAVLDAGYDYTFIGCTAYSNTSRGFLIQNTGSSGQTKLIGCRSINNGFGYQIDATPNPFVTMVGCEEVGNTTHAIFAGTTYAAIAGNMTAPAVPATTVALTNPFPMAMQVLITGGTFTVLAVDGVTTGFTASPVTVTVRAGGTITLTYTVAPTWKWWTIN